MKNLKYYELLPKLRTCEKEEYHSRFKDRIESFTQLIMYTPLLAMQVIIAMLLMADVCAVKNQITLVLVLTMSMLVLCVGYIMIMALQAKEWRAQKTKQYYGGKNEEPKIP